MPVSEYTYQPAFLIDFDLVMEAARNPIANPNLSTIESRILEYKERGFLICGIHNRPSVGLELETEARYISEVEFALSKFKENPFSLVKSSYFGGKSAKGVFGRRSFLTLPDYGMLVVIEWEMWEAGKAVTWEDSIIVGSSPTMTMLSHKSGVTLRGVADVFGAPQQPSG